MLEWGMVHVKIRYRISFVSAAGAEDLRYWGLDILKYREPVQSSWIDENGVAHWKIGHTVNEVVLYVTWFHHRGRCSIFANTWLVWILGKWLRLLQLWIWTDPCKYLLSSWAKPSCSEIKWYESSYACAISCEDSCRSLSPSDIMAVSL